MPVYGADQCTQCGAIRAAGSPLCVDCLVGAYDRSTKDYYEKGKEIGDLKEKVKMLMSMTERLLDHISTEAVYPTELRIKLLRIERGENGKNRME